MTGDTPEKLADVLKVMRAALAKPMLGYEDFQNRFCYKNRLSAITRPSVEVAGIVSPASSACHPFPVRACAFTRIRDDYSLQLPEGVFLS